MVLAASFLALLLGGCENRGDLLGVELVVFEVGLWQGTSPDGNEIRFILERDDDEAVLSLLLVNIPGLVDAVQGDPAACRELTDAFSSFIRGDLRVPLRKSGFMIRIPGDFAVDANGLVEAEIDGRFDAPDSAMVDAEIRIDASRFVPCRAEMMVSWQVEPVGS